MIYMKLYESYHLAKTVEEYADIIQAELDKYEGKIIKKIRVKIDNPKDDFKITYIDVLFKNRCAFSGNDSNMNKITLLLPPSYHYMELLHELTHAYQFWNKLKNNITAVNFTGDFTRYLKSVSRNKDFRMLLNLIYFSDPLEQDAYITSEYMIDDDVEMNEWLEVMKNFDANIYNKKLGT